MIHISYLDLGKYIRAFDDTPEGRKTKIYTLVNQKNELIHLGIIKWHAAWRQYCFFPEDETVFNKTCLKDIMCFLEDLNKKRQSNK